MDLHAWITQQVDAVERAAPPHGVGCDSLPKARSCCGAEECYCGHDDTFPCDCGVPAAVLRRCEADRRILARHREWAQSSYCEACDQDLTTNLNDCPELLDLAHAHGITPETLARLDRPEPPEPKPSTGRLGLGDILATPPITTSDVPEALRGPRWKP